MPLIKSGSKKALKKNIEVEMEAHPAKKDRKQDLAIAFSVQRKNKAKKMAEGGSVSASDEKRPMPDQKADDSKMVSRNAVDKPAHDDSWTDRSTVAQAQKPSLTRLSQPKMVGSDAFSVRSREEADKDLMRMDSMPPESPKAQPPGMYNEEEASKKGPSVPALKMKRMAEGGHVSLEIGKGPEEDELEHPEGLEEDADQMSPARDEYMAGHFADGGPVYQGSSRSRSRPDPIVVHDDSAPAKYKPSAMSAPSHPPMAAPDEDHPINDTSGYAMGGHVENMSEEEEEHHMSIAAAIMAKRDRMAKAGSDSDEDSMMHMAEGGELDSNAEESPNQYYKQNQAALKENYDSDMEDVSQPSDSNEDGDMREEDSENKRDMISSIRSKMNMKRQFR